MNSELVQVVVLAIVQGIAEFLPVSSSGHLVALSAWFDQDLDSAELNVVLHFGTLLAILVFYRKQIWEMIGKDRRVIGPLIAGTIPVAATGLWIKTNHPELLDNALLAGFMLVVTAFLLMALVRLPPGKRDYRHTGYLAAVFIGCFQALALLPGISRSGATIVAGRVTGLESQSAATFSFLLAIPAIFGASLLEAREIANHGTQTAWPLLVLGAVIAFVTGLLALRWLVRWVEQGRLHLFAYWLVPLGFSVVIWQLYGMLDEAGIN